MERIKENKKIVLAVGAVVGLVVLTLVLVLIFGGKEKQPQPEPAPEPEPEEIVEEELSVRPKPEITTEPTQEELKAICLTRFGHKKGLDGRFNNAITFHHILHIAPYLNGFGKQSCLVLALVTKTGMTRRYPVIAWIDLVIGDDLFGDEQGELKAEYFTNPMDMRVSEEDSTLIDKDAVIGAFFTTLIKEQLDKDVVVSGVPVDARVVDNQFVYLNLGTPEQPDVYMYDMMARTLTEEIEMPDDPSLQNGLAVET